MTINLYIVRSDDWDTSYDLWGKQGGIPLEEGDGFFIGNYPIEPDETELTIPWDPPHATLEYGVLAVPIQRRSKGPASGFTP